MELTLAWKARNEATAGQARTPAAIRLSLRHVPYE